MNLPHLLAGLLTQEKQLSALPRGTLVVAGRQLPQFRPALVPLLVKQSKQPVTSLLSGARQLAAHPGWAARQRQQGYSRRPKWSLLSAGLSGAAEHSMQRSASAALVP